MGCAYVIADSVEAEYAVAGTVATVPSGSRVRISIIDVPNAREALTFEIDLAVGDDRGFAEAVAEVLARKP